ncbi:MAG: PP2C family protein-serine/threonine phosphatase, partial [Vulcanimicrobiaceae bacterium]
GMLVGKANSPSAVRTFLLHALEQANERLFSASGSTDDFVAGGVSLTAALVAGHHVFIGHVGDSRAYVLRLGRLEALTADDAIFTNAVASSKSSLPAKPALRGLLWRSLGTQSRLEASIAHVELLPGDQLLLCTDGVHRAVFVDEIESALTESDSAAEVASRLLLMTKVRGIADSATVLVGRDLLTPEMPTADPHGGAALMARVWLIAALLSSIAAASWFALHHL